MNFGFIGKIGGAIVNAAEDTVGNVAGKTIGKVVDALFEDGIGGILNKGLNLPGGFGNIAEKLLDTLLPKELESVGDLVSMAINYGTGNYPAAIEDGLDLLKDLPGVLNNLGQNAATAPGTTPWGSTPLLNLVNSLAPNTATVASAPIGAPPALDQNGARLASPPLNAPPALDANGAPLTIVPSEHVQSKPAAKATSGDTPTTVKSSLGSSTTKSSEKSTEASSTSAAKKSENSAGVEATKKFLDAHKNPEDLMAQVRNGNIPEEILNSPAGMMMLQDKLHKIQELNTLMSQMLKAMHDMTMSIIQNMRA